jgi:hypothetical protein
VKLWKARNIRFGFRSLMKFIGVRTMINLKVIGAAALLAIAPVLASSVADARPGGGGFSRGGGGGAAFRGGGGGGFRGGGFAARPALAADSAAETSPHGRVSVAGRASGISVAAISDVLPSLELYRSAVTNRSWRPVAQLGGGRRWKKPALARTALARSRLRLWCRTGARRSRLVVLL